MERVQIKEIFRNQKDYVGKEISVCGWIRQIRDSKKLGFIELNSIFSNLEKAIKENDIDYVKNNIKTSLKVFKKYIEISKEYLGK